MAGVFYQKEDTLGKALQGFQTIAQMDAMRKQLELENRALDATIEHRARMAALQEEFQDAQINNLGFQQYLATQNLGDQKNRTGLMGRELNMRGKAMERDAENDVARRDYINAQTTAIMSDVETKEELRQHTVDAAGSTAAMARFQLANVQKVAETEIDKILPLKVKLMEQGLSQGAEQIKQMQQEATAKKLGLTVSALGALGSFSNSPEAQRAILGSLPEGSNLALTAPLGQAFTADQKLSSITYSLLDNDQFAADILATKLYGDTMMEAPHPAIPGLTIKQPMSEYKSPEIQQFLENRKRGSTTQPSKPQASKRDNSDPSTLQKNTDAIKSESDSFGLVKALVERRTDAKAVLTGANRKGNLSLEDVYSQTRTELHAARNKRKLSTAEESQIATAHDPDKDGTQNTVFRLMLMKAALSDNPDAVAQGFLKKFGGKYLSPYQMQYYNTLFTPRGATPILHEAEKK